jgi:hypothetical protein
MEHCTPGQLARQRITAEQGQGDRNASETEHQEGE